MKRIMTIGIGSPQLPSFKIALDVLESTDVIQPKDLALIGKSELDYHAWTPICHDSCFVGRTLEQANKELNEGAGFARRLVVARKA
jgi:hypothetical protein